VLFQTVFASAFSGAISESQHTRCVHRTLPGLAGAFRPSPPIKTSKTAAASQQPKSHTAGGRTYQFPAETERALRV